MTFQLELLERFKPEWSKLQVLHWQEIAVDQEDIPLACDWQKYADMEASGCLRILTVRDNDRLIGYYMAFILPHPHYARSGLMGFTDIYYILPEYREGSLGLQLLIEAEKMFRAEGCKKVYSSCKAHTDLTPLFEYLGWKLTDKMFTKLL